MKKKVQKNKVKKTQKNDKKKRKKGGKKKKSAKKKVWVNSKFPIPFSLLFNRIFNDVII